MKKQPGYKDAEVAALMRADRHRGNPEKEFGWADAVAAVVGKDPITAAGIAERTTLSPKQVAGALVVLRERGVAVVKTKDGLRIATGDDEIERWRQARVAQLRRDVEAMAGSKRFGDGAPDDVRASATALLARLEPAAVAVDLNEPATVAEPALAKPKRAKTKAKVDA